MATKSTKGKLIEGIATKVEIDTETGAATLYYADRKGNFQVGATAPSAAQLSDKSLTRFNPKDWELKRRFRREFNIVTDRSFTSSQFEDFFKQQIRKDVNRDRGDLINDHGNNALKTDLSKLGMPRVRNPETGIDGDKTRKTESTDETEDSNNSGDNRERSNISESGVPGAGVDIEQLTGNGGTLVYPAGLDKDSQVCLKIEAIAYSPREMKGTQVGDRSLGKAEATIFLPVPEGASDRNGVRFSQENLNPLEVALSSLAMQGIEQGAEGVGAAAQNIVDEIQGDTATYKGAIAGILAGQAAGVGNQLLTRQGRILNPNTELLFQGPELRQFSFRYLLSPRSSGESKTVRAIVRTLKQFMAVKKGGEGNSLFLQSPHIFRLTYVESQSGDTPNDFLNMFKPCALTALSTNYAPNQTFMTFEDGTPVQYELNMSFQELVPIYQGDYTSGNNIGF